MHNQRIKLFKRITKWHTKISQRKVTSINQLQETTDSCRAIQALEDSVVTTTTSAGDALTSVTLSEGTIIFGKFDSVTLASGKVLAYKAVL